MRFEYVLIDIYVYTSVLVAESTEYFAHKKMKNLYIIIIVYVFNMVTNIHIRMHTARSRQESQRKNATAAVVVRQQQEKEKRLCNLVCKK